MCKHRGPAEILSDIPMRSELKRVSNELREGRSLLWKTCVVVQSRGSSLAVLATQAHDAVVHQDGAVKSVAHLGDL